MSDEQHSTKILACRIEGGQPRLSQAGRQDDQPGFVADLAGRLERCECFLLDGMRRRRWFRGLLDDFNHSLERNRAASFAIRVDPIQIDGACLGMNKQVVERTCNLSETTICVRTKDTVVPFHAALQCRPSQVRAADERRALTVPVVEDVCLRME